MEIPLANRNLRGLPYQCPLRSDVNLARPRLHCLLWLSRPCFFVQLTRAGGRRGPSGPAIEKRRAPFPGSPATRPRAGRGALTVGSICRRRVVGSRLRSDAGPLALGVALHRRHCPCGPRAGVVISDGTSALTSFSTPAPSNARGAVPSVARIHVPILLPLGHPINLLTIALAVIFFSRSSKVVHT
jgi:hypothetical protein